jgi:metal-dependent HD superfamily phosphatase/phosphodiesterase
MLQAITPLQGAGASQSMEVTLEDVKRDILTDTLIRAGNSNLGAMGYTEHGYRHINLVANIAHNVLKRLGFTKREAELAAIAGYLHDIGNVVNREGHHLAGAVLAYSILERLGMTLEEIGSVTAAIGNHDEETGSPVSSLAAALILADKSDVHRSRVRNIDVANFDIHDRVNYAVERSFLRVSDPDTGLAAPVEEGAAAGAAGAGIKRTIILELEIDPEISPVMDYFEIFLTRMLLCRRSANFLGCLFGLQINGHKLI